MSDGRDIHARHVVRGIFLLFSQGHRPDNAAIHAFAEQHPSVSVAHDPATQPVLHIVEEGDTPKSIARSQAELAEERRSWVELLRDGLTFDLEGLAPGNACEVPDTEHRFDSNADSNASRVEAIRLVAGAHLFGGEASLPVLRGMLGLARDIVQHFEEVQAIVWPPSSSLIGRRFFESTITAWLEGGAFPALGLTAFRQTLDGGLQSVGLDFLIGQELRIEPELARDKVAATRLGVRLVNQLVLSGAVERVEQLIGPQGESLRLEPSSNGKFIRVRGR